MVLEVIYRDPQRGCALTDEKGWVGGMRWWDNPVGTAKGIPRAQASHI